MERIYTLQSLEYDKTNQKRVAERVEQCMAWQGWTHADMAKLVERITVDGDGEVKVFLRLSEIHLPI